MEYYLNVIILYKSIKLHITKIINFTYKCGIACEDSLFESSKFFCLHCVVT